MSDIITFFPKPTFFPNQREAIEEIANALATGKRFIILESGTGTGKSMMMYTTCKFLGDGHICTMQKSLQLQYKKEGIPSVEGRDNFRCTYFLKNGRVTQCSTGKCVTSPFFRCEHKPRQRIGLLSNKFLNRYYSDKIQLKVQRALEHFKLNSNSSEEEIKSSFRKLVLIHHPDKGGNPEDFINDKNNYDILKDNIEVFQFNGKKLHIDKNFACESGRGVLYWESEEHCKYWEQKCAAIESPIACHNYHYLITESNHVGDFGKRTLLGCDEAHNLDKIISDFVKVTLTDTNLKDVNMVFMDFGKNVADWIIFISEVQNKLFIKLETKKEELDAVRITDPSHPVVQELETLVMSFDNLYTKLTKFLENYATTPNNWVILINKNRDQRIESIDLKPVYIGNYAQELLFRLGEKVLMMSATIIDPVRLCEELGIPLAEAHYINVPVPFDPRRSPIFSMNVGKINAKTFDDRNDNFSTKKIMEVVEAISKILLIHKNQKGIIHCTSNRVRNVILENIDPYLKTRLLVPTAGNKRLIMERHANTIDPTVLLSISDEEGLDLADDLSRFQIFPVLPFPSLSDPRIAKRAEIDPVWYDLEMLRRIIQAAGRSVRNKDDYAFTYFLPSQFAFYIKKFNELFKNNIPSSYEFFRNRIRWDKEGLGECVIT